MQRAIAGMDEDLEPFPSNLLLHVNLFMGVPEFD
jgi:hypothetical protein